MSKLIEISSEDAANFYQVSPAVASQPFTIFYGSEEQPTQGLDNDPWPLITFSKSIENRVSIQISTLYLEFLHFDTFDPLTEPFSGSIRLSENQLKSFGSILLRYRKRLIKSENQLKSSKEFLSNFRKK